MCLVDVAVSHRCTSWKKRLYRLSVPLRHSYTSEGVPRSCTVPPCVGTLRRSRCTCTFKYSTLMGRIRIRLQEESSGSGKIIRIWIDIMGKCVVFCRLFVYFVIRHLFSRLFRGIIAKRNSAGNPS